MGHRSRRRALLAWTLLVLIGAALAWGSSREPIRAAAAAAGGGRVASTAPGD